MKELTGFELQLFLQGHDLFKELFQVAVARKYREALLRARAWQLEEGEALPRPIARRGAYVVLSGHASLDGRPADEGVVKPRRVFGQWTALRNLPLREVPIASEESIILECSAELRDLLLSRRSSEFKVAYYQPLVAQLEALAGTPPDVLEKVIRTSRFTRYHTGDEIVEEGDHANTMFFLLEGEAMAFTSADWVDGIEPGKFFGEIAVVTYGTRTATVVAATDCLVMECGRIGVGDLRKKNKAFKDIMDLCVRERAVGALLDQVPLFDGLDKAQLDAIRQSATLETFDAYEPVIFQGDPADALFMILHGTMSAIRETEHGTVPVRWLRSGDMIGEIALLKEMSGSDRRTMTITTLQRADVVRIPSDVVTNLMADSPRVKARLEKTVRERMDTSASLAHEDGLASHISWVLDTQHLVGRQVLAVDMERCIRCNNCMTACEAVHPDGLNRFFWSTMRQNNDVLPNVRLSHSCQHCEYALCMVACPTQCIHRDVEAGNVYIDYDNCIRCGSCADPSKGCPYGSIYVVPADQVNTQKEETPSLLMRLLKMGRAEPESGGATSKSGSNYPVKCDLCQDLPYQACVEHCPTGAVFRISGLTEFTNILRNAPPRTAIRDEAEERIPLFVHAEFTHLPTAGRPAEIRVTLKKHPPGQPIYCRKPEPGVPELKLNFYLSTSDSIRIGRGGPLQQIILTPETPEGTLGYAVTMPKAGHEEMVLCVYQGGLYLGRAGIRMECAAPQRVEAPAAAS
jgi:CRP-like cAMP-binding protein/Fe-S-cluster-containing dehydrogenase component